MIDHIKLKKVTFLPVLLDPGLLYVSKKYSIAGHLCPCGCGNKIITPLGETEWNFKIKNDKPSLFPSIGNWQLPCKSHYWIIKGEIVWACQWTEEQIKDAWDVENYIRELHFRELDQKDKGSTIFKRIKKYFKFL